MYDNLDRFIEDIKLDKFDSHITNAELAKLVNVYDKHGRTLLHWAAFLGKNTILSELLHQGADTSLPSETDDNFQAIHFSTVNNHTDCLRTLINHGVSIETCDMFRRTPLCIAAFYGRTIASSFLLSQHANRNHRDMNGNTALHFAALSGNADLCQILLYSGIDIRTTNDFGETAVHLASRRGSKRLLKSLSRGHPELWRQPDVRGVTPLGHGKSHRNEIAIDWLQRQMHNSGSMSFRWKRTDLLYGCGRSKYALTFLVVMVFFFAVPVYVSDILFLTFADWPILNSLLIVDGILVGVALYAVNSMGPGYLPRFTRRYDDTLREAASGGHSEADILRIFGRLCHTCRTVKPVRASHCDVCRRCVREMDHHCPYVDNCIGYRNRQCFLGFLVVLWWGMMLGVVMAAIVWWQYGYEFAVYEYCGLALVAVFLGFVSLTLMGALWGAARNITTNEMIKWNRYGYEYLRDGAGGFVNPFDRGVMLNVLAFFRIVVTFRQEGCDTIDV